MSASLTLRVMVPEVWDEATLTVPPATPVARLKADALATLRVAGDPAGYVVKFRGSQLLDETGSLADHGVVDNANLIVLPRRRRPVR